MASAWRDEQAVVAKATHTGLMRATAVLLVIVIVVGFDLARAGAPLAIVSASYGDPAGLVDLLIGTDGNGHTSPGAVMPFGMVQFNPITTGGGPGGYQYS